MASLTHSTPDIVNKSKDTSEGANYILDILLTEYPQ